ncbi:MAG: hypothetical protein OXG04_15645 [Acidobacteria bacterium]|nr:hypothetical protein [Acidobacteriota bacterium]
MHRPYPPASRALLATLGIATLPHAAAQRLRLSSLWRRGISMPLTRAPGYEMYEYACHEGNLDVAIHLGGGRVEEAGR